MNRDAFIKKKLLPNWPVLVLLVLLGLVFAFRYWLVADASDDRLAEFVAESEHQLCVTNKVIKHLGYVKEQTGDTPKISMIDLLVFDSDCKSKARVNDPSSLPRQRLRERISVLENQ